MKSLEIRKKFFDYFVKHGHEKVASSGLIPAQDPTLLFANAGMNQFKDLFLGNEKRNYKIATTIQKCVRAGGKHNDLDNVGFTKRHLTYFEMMGNFSFGDYFKKEAIPFAWNCLINEYGLDPKDLYVSVFETDEEAYNIWKNDVGVAEDHIMRFDERDNFWQMGDTGPCGPCTEIYIDQRTDRSKAPVYEDFDEGRFLELWNLVFMQYDKQENGELKPLKQTGVDTGMGLERLAGVLQGKDNVFETDLFTPLIAEIERLTGVNYSQQEPKLKAAFHVLCDHIRSSSLIIADGGSPSNEGRGYVLRKIIRRAALFAQKLTDKNIFPELAKKFIEELSGVYPELKTNETIIVSLLKNEIEQFSTNLVKGQNILENFFKESASNKIITGQQAFKLYDTYGFPLEVTILASEEHGYTVDSDGFETCMNKQRELSGKKMKSTDKKIIMNAELTTEFVGYTETDISSSVVGFIVNDIEVSTIRDGSDCMVICNKTPFFAATGGQVDDEGWITINDERMPVKSLTKLNNGKAIGIGIKAQSDMKVGDLAQQTVEMDHRRITANNHTSTHLLQAALIELLGKQIKQSGSVVDPDYLRFDFTYHKNLTPEEIKIVEDRVNDIIRQNIALNVFETSYKEAVAGDVIAIFGEKYNPECVRVVDVPGFSAELCGGTHVPTTGVIGAFKITEVGALSAGNRRIFAVTGPRAVELMQRNFTTVKALSQKFKVKPMEVVDAVKKQDEQLHTAQLEIRHLKKQLLKTQIPLWESQIEDVNNIPFLYLHLNNLDGNELKDIVDALQERVPGFYVAISNTDDKSSFYASLAPKHNERMDFKTFKKWMQESAGLRGGGKPGTLQGGGKKVDKPLGDAIKTGLLQ
jgi:alanyl-tRNA synthetase